MLCNEPSQLTEQDKDMITNLVVNALKMSLNDFGLVNMAENQKLSLEDILQECSPSAIICWGYSPPNFTSSYVPGNFQGQRILIVDSLSTFHNNPLLKKKLWNAIQLLFSEA